MTGIERLRELADKYAELSKNHMMIHVITSSMATFFSNIADQIDREQGSHVSRTRVLSVITDMERHVLGHEGMEDSPVARWARELREALGRHCRDGVGDTVADSPYDAITPEDREAIAWVRDHGGLETVEARLMPEGCEWPMFEDGEPVKFGDMALIDGEDDMVEAVQLWIHGKPVIYGDGGSQQLERGERVKRPAPKVLDVDGAEIREKCDVWWICEGDERGVHAERLRVETICPNGLIECSPYNGGTWVYLEPSELYVNEPVIAADGRPLHEGETVWVTRDSPCDAPLDKGYEVTVIHAYPKIVGVEDETGESWIVYAGYLTHEPPDSWELLEEDADKDYVNYWGCERIPCYDCPAIVDGKKPDERYIVANCSEAVKCDLVRRAKALAGVTE